jgi:hypothetical protein
MKERIGRRKSALSGNLNEGLTFLVLGTSLIALALAISGLNWAFSFFSAPNLFAPFASANLRHRRRPTGISAGLLGSRFVDPGRRSSGRPGTFATLLGGRPASIAGRTTVDSHGHAIRI